jgi:1,3,6,8-tetrahydroxynaphthalene synthase
MAVLCRPALLFPAYEITLKDTLESARQIHSGHPRLDTALRLIEHTGVRTRRILQPLSQVLQHPGVTARAKLYWNAVHEYLPPLVQSALASADISKDQISAVIFVSCTGFSMPSPIAWLINELGFPPAIHQLPIAQLGCTAGSASIDIAAQYCRAYPDRNALIVAFELCSLCYQPTDTDIGSLLSAGLFGDGFAAAVMKSTASTGIRIEQSTATMIPGTSDWISYEVKDTGFHFRLDSRVRTTMREIAPEITTLVKDAGWNSEELDFLIAHAGGPRILDDLTRYLDIDPSLHQYSRAALSEHGNTASVLIFDALARFLASDTATPGARGLIAGFGPGISADISLGTVL